MGLGPLEPLLADSTVSDILVNGCNQVYIERKGLLPIRTTRGDRLFIGLLGSAYIHLAWLGLTDLSLWWALAISVAWAVALMRWG